MSDTQIEILSHMRTAEDLVGINGVVPAGRIPVGTRHLGTRPSVPTWPWLMFFARPMIKLQLAWAYRGIRHAKTPAEVASILHRIYDNSKQRADIDVHEERSSVTITVTHCDFNRQLGSGFTKHLCQIDFDHLTAMPQLTIRKNMGSTIAHGGKKCITEIHVASRDRNDSV